MQITKEMSPRERAHSILTQVAQARSTVYGWLALSFYPPDAELERMLADGTMAGELWASTAWLGADREALRPDIEALETFAACTLECLQAEHQRLFGKSVERVSPCEATYRWKATGDILAAADDVRGWLQQLYAQFGVAPVGETADHIAVQMEFMAYLCSLEARQWQAGTSHAARQLRRQESDFLADHPAQWIAEFHRQMGRQTRPSFYAAAASLAARWLTLEQGPNRVPARAR